jgi:hypothetical protein
MNIYIAHMESARYSESGKLFCRMALGYDAGTRMACGIVRINRQVRSVGLRYDAGTCMACGPGIVRINRQVWSVVSGPLGWTLNMESRFQW